MIVGLGNDHIMKESVYEVETYRLPTNLTGILIACPV